MKLKAYDFIIILLGLLIIVVFSLYAYTGNNGSLYVHIESFQDEWLLPLDKNEEINVKGPIGITKVEVKDGRAHVVSSPCKEKICIRSGYISKPGQWIACLPNRVFVYIEGKRGKKNEVDAINF